MPLAVSWRAMSPAVNPPPTMTTVRFSSFLTTACSDQLKSTMDLGPLAPGYGLPRYRTMSSVCVAGSPGYPTNCQNTLLLLPPYIGSAKQACTNSGYTRSLNHDASGTRGSLYLPDCTSCRKAFASAGNNWSNGLPYFFAQASPAAVNPVLNNWAGVSGSWKP